MNDRKANRIILFGNKLDYIRIRLYLMASFEDFEEMVDKKVHLYLERSFITEIARRSSVNPKRSTLLLR